jgi:hypothetical protein
MPTFPPWYNYVLVEPGRADAAIPAFRASLTPLVGMNPEDAEKAHAGPWLAINEESVGKVTLFVASGRGWTSRINVVDGKADAGEPPEAAHLSEGEVAKIDHALDALLRRTVDWPAWRTWMDENGVVTSPEATPH